MNKTVLVNALGICDSGGVTVFTKFLQECSVDTRYRFVVICHDSGNIRKLYKSYELDNKFHFHFVANKGILHRLKFENIDFTNLIASEQISLIYNLTGSGKIFSSIPQLTKVQNLLFYSKKLDYVYFRSSRYLQWIKQILLKRYIFRILLMNVENIEVQSEHVKDSLMDYLGDKKRNVFIKSDVSVESGECKEVKHYDFSKTITFLYIIGPHFAFPHKNFKDFVDAMLILQSKELDFTIKITLKKHELMNCMLWDDSLNEITDFLGYINEKEALDAHFQDNTILISNSIIETLGLHVIEAIKNGIIAIVPDEAYSKDVYGENILKYPLFEADTLADNILELLSFDDNECLNIVSSTQHDLLEYEKKKISNVIEIFDEIFLCQKNI